VLGNVRRQDSRWSISFRRRPRRASLRAHPRERGGNRVTALACDGDPHEHGGTSDICYTVPHTLAESSKGARPIRDDRAWPRRADDDCQGYAVRAGNIARTWRAEGAMPSSVQGIAMKAVSRPLYRLYLRGLQRFSHVCQKSGWREGLLEK
jgi:hypothetical protein